MDESTVWLPGRLLSMWESKAGAPHCSLLLPFQPQSSQGHKSLLSHFLAMATCAWVRGQAASLGCPWGGHKWPVRALHVPCASAAHPLPVLFSRLHHHVSQHFITNLAVAPCFISISALKTDQRFN